MSPPRTTSGMGNIVTILFKGLLLEMVNTPGTFFVSSLFSENTAVHGGTLCNPSTRETEAGSL